MYLGFPRFGKRRDVFRQKNVLRFQIRVDDLALCVQEVQAVADLHVYVRKSSDSTTRHPDGAHARPHRSGDLPHDFHRDSFVLERFDEREEVVAQHFKHHAHVCERNKRNI